jgi:methyl-accepting chemotaxis protein
MKKLINNAKENRMKRFSLKYKIMIGGLLPLVFLIVINVIGLMNLNGLLDGLKSVNHTHIVIQDAILIQKIAVDMETGERGFLLTGNEDFLEPYNRWAKEYNKVIDHAENSVSDNPKQVALLQQAHVILDAWKTDVADKYIAKRKELNNTKSKDTLNIISKLVSTESGKIHMDKFRELMNTIINNEKELLKNRKNVAETLTEDTNKIIIGGTLAAVILAIIIAIFLIKAVIQPINNLQECAIKISRGDLDTDLDVNSNDELGDLANSFRETISYFQEVSHVAQSIGSGELDVEIKKRSEKDLLAESFKGMIHSLHESAQIAHAIGEGNLDVEIKKNSQNDVLAIALQNMLTNLRKIMSELLEGTLVLNTAAGQILATTSQIASSAAETSSAISQTTSSVEEIKQTAKLSSEKAVHTAESTKKAVIVSDEGYKSLDNNMEGLAQIKNKMDLIAANIIRLSEQSQLIGNIVTTVEDIASQSNLLAVNASIEAVKAGEQGKGFSVVAQELKNLANQSKQGTAEVQKILSDIQQATNTLVMVAEQGGKAVDEGMIQAKNTKKSIELLRASVMETAQAGTLIAVSSQQELAGMDQIANAMMSIKEATYLNVNNIREVESSAKNLNTLSQKLKSLMDQYHFKQSDQG